MALGTPYVACSNAAGSGSTSQVVTASHAVATGDAITVVCSTGSNSVTPSAVTDSKSNTYTQLSTTSSTNSMCSYVFQALNATALVSGTDTITVTWSSTSNSKNMVAIGCSGVATSSAFDATATAQASSTAPSATTPALAQSSELAVAACAFGNAGTAITWASGWTSQATAHTGTALFTAVATQAETASSAVTASGTLTGSSVAWSMMVVTLKAAVSGAGLAITTTSPLPGGTVGTAYSDQLTASGGSPPYTWSATSLPAGLTITAGSQGSGGSGILHIAGVGGPNGSPGQSMSDFTNAQNTIGPLTGIKLFVSGDLPTSWTAAVWSTGISLQTLLTAYPNVVPILAWNGPGSSLPSSAQTIQQFASTIPAGFSVGFDWQSEPENPTSGITAKQFTDGFASTANAIHSLGRTTYTNGVPSGLFTITSSAWGQYGPMGDAISGNYLPGPSFVDVYGMDIYQHELGGSFNGATTWSTNGLSNSAFFQTWLKLVQPFGRPMACTEYGIDSNITGTGETAAGDAERAQRLQQDYNYLTTAFNGGSASPYPFFMWLYWWHNMAAINNDYKFTDSTAVTQWQGYAAAAGGSGSSNPGGLIAGTPTTAGTSSVSATVTDSTTTQATKSLSLTISSASASVAVQTVTLDNATLGSLYNNNLGAGGGTPPYTWSLATGALPPGLTLANSANGLLTQDAGFENPAFGTDNWAPAGNSSIAWTNAQAHAGTASMAVTSAASGNMQAASVTAASIVAEGVTTNPGDQVTGSAWLKAASAGRSVNVGIDFYSAAGAFLSTSRGSNVSDVTTGWTQATVTVSSAPASAQFMRLNVQVLSTGAASEVHYVDDAFLSDQTTGNGIISGVPTTAGNYSFTVQATDTLSSSGTAVLSIAVSAGLTVTTASLPAGTLNSAYTATLTASGGTSPYSWGLPAGVSLPAGLTLSAGGVLSGTPTVSGSFTLTFTVTDSASSMATSAPLTLAIATTTGLPAIGRRQFGGDTSDWTFRIVAGGVQPSAGVVITFWTAISGGTQYTDLTDLNANPITSATTDANGFMPQFFGPAGIWFMYADANGGAGPRRLVQAGDIGAMVTTIHDALKLLTG